MSRNARKTSGDRPPKTFHSDAMRCGAMRSLRKGPRNLHPHALHDVVRRDPFDAEHRRDHKLQRLAERVEVARDPLGVAVLRACIRRREPRRKPRRKACETRLRRGLQLACDATRDEALATRDEDDGTHHPLAGREPPADVRDVGELARVAHGPRWEFEG